MPSVIRRASSSSCKLACCRGTRHIRNQSRSSSKDICKSPAPSPNKPCRQSSNKCKRHSSAVCKCSRSNQSNTHSTFRHHACSECCTGILPEHRRDPATSCRPRRCRSCNRSCNRLHIPPCEWCSTAIHKLQCRSSFRRPHSGAFRPSRLHIRSCEDLFSSCSFPLQMPLACGASTRRAELSCVNSSRSSGRLYNR